MQVVDSCFPDVHKAILCIFFILSRHPEQMPGLGRKDVGVERQVEHRPNEHFQKRSPIRLPGVN